ncbi:large ribosomal subunit protein mL38-like [Asterias amurensis]|uniref:large ribosomal subunit protein mL38-like n=1 Tax=Asterias amurensis TaxID=7602 RepID=UPI003AB178F2
MAAPLGRAFRQISRNNNHNFAILGCIKRQLNTKSDLKCNVGRQYAGASTGIDIGLPIKPTFQPGKKPPKERLMTLSKNKNDPDLERAARRRTLQVSLDEVKAEWEQTSAPYHIRRIAHHYGIFKDLFDSADFLPQVMMKIDYRVDAEHTMPVFTGNVVTPTEASQPPDINYTSTNDKLWTLLLTNPDGHLQDNSKEYVHWMIGNIPGNQLSQGDEIFDYLPPFPARGTGYHRFAFVLFQQDGRVDYSAEGAPLPCRNLKERTFETLEFYRQYQDVITPAGLAFFQCRWDQSVTETFHHTLEMREPVFDYNHPKIYIAEQKKFPHKKPLQYLLKYMPQEQRDKIKDFNPFFPDRRFEK